MIEHKIVKIDNAETAPVSVMDFREFPPKMYPTMVSGGRPALCYAELQVNNKKVKVLFDILTKSVTDISSEKERGIVFQHYQQLLVAIVPEDKEYTPYFDMSTSSFVSQDSANTTPVVKVNEENGYILETVARIIPRLKEKLSEKLRENPK